MKLNLIIDASGIFYRTLFTVGNYGNAKGEKLLDSKHSQGVFVRKLATDLSALVRGVENVDRTIIAMDSSSWRKTIAIDDGGYKIDRKKDESTINWNAFYELTDKFCELLTQKGYIKWRIPGAEADDLLYLGKKKFNEAGENVILMTGDRDMLQTLCYNENGTWTIALDPVLNRKKVSVTKETLEAKSSNEPNEVSLFDTSTWVDAGDVLDSLMKSHELNIVDPVKIRVKKILLGDGGDSVPSVVTWPNSKNPAKMSNITDSVYTKILIDTPAVENLDWKMLQEGIHLEDIARTIERVKKITVNRDKLLANIERNCKLVILDSSVIPVEIQNLFHESHSQVPESVAISSRDSLLTGTEWWTNDKNDFIPKSYDLF